MISTNMRTYNYSTLGEPDAYGVPAYNPDEITGSVKMAIYLTSQSTQENINYLNSNYVGLTMDKSINDKMIIHYGEEKLKVLYINPQGRVKQVYLERL